ncbi:hypothetical protein HDU84_008062 [Entophlyctis sp. JEL0112]|nr:hypothetical protein HDU84_008062 [Entophlyctis sp. JEL0112]
MHSLKEPQPLFAALRLQNQNMPPLPDPEQALAPPPAPAAPVKKLKKKKQLASPSATAATASNSPLPESVTKPKPKGKTKKKTVRTGAASPLAEQSPAVPDMLTETIPAIETVPEHEKVPTQHPTAHHSPALPPKSFIESSSILSVDSDNMPLASLSDEKKDLPKPNLNLSSEQTGKNSLDSNDGQIGTVTVVRRLTPKPLSRIMDTRNGRRFVANSDSSDSPSDSDSSDPEVPPKPNLFSRSGSNATIQSSANGAASPRSVVKKTSFLGAIAATLTSVIAPELSPTEKSQRLQDEAYRRQLENNAKFAALRQAVPGLLPIDDMDDSIDSIASATTVASRASEKQHTFAGPRYPMPDSEREFAAAMGLHSARNFASARKHFERAVKIDENAESLRMLAVLHGPTSDCPNAAKVTEYKRRLAAVLDTSQGKLNHGRHLARIGGKGYDGAGIVFVREAADAGNPEAMFEFGMYLRDKGKGAEAMIWLHRAADSGWEDAEEAVAEGYEQGLGVVKDDVAGAAWRSRVNTRLRLEIEKQAAEDTAKAELTRQLRKEAMERELEKMKQEAAVQRRQEALARRRAEDPQLNSALRNLDWGFYVAGVEQLAGLALLGSAEARDFLDPELSVISPKAVTAMFHIGQHHSRNADPATAVKWFRRSAESGYHEAQVTYAAYLIVGKGLESPDPGQAMAWLMKAWETGNNKEAALALGEAYTKGIGVAPDPTKAVKWYTRAWEIGGYSEAAFAVGLACATGFTPGAVDPSAWWTHSQTGGRKNINEVLDRRTKDSEKGNAGESVQMGVSPSSPTKSGSADKALPPKPARVDSVGEDIQSASNQNSPLSIPSSTLGSAPAPDRRSASNTSANSLGNAGQFPVNSPMLKNFSAFKQDVEQAAIWYKKASDLGHSRACNNLGELYMTGRGIPRNDVVGFGLFRRAAMAGLPEAEYNMGRCCREGRGCAKNEEQAVMWFKRAEAQGIKEATKALAVKPQAE